jgi:type I restriction-modification system DNA methylase subunit
MKWTAPSEKDAATTTLEKRLWDAADQLRANSGLKPQEYSGPILGLIFLRFAEVRFADQRRKSTNTSKALKLLMADFENHVCQLALLALFNMLKSYKSQQIHNSDSPGRE